MEADGAGTGGCTAFVRPLLHVVCTHHCTVIGPGSRQQVPQRGAPSVHITGSSALQSGISTAMPAAGTPRSTSECHNAVAAKLLRSWGTYCPSFGPRDVSPEYLASVGVRAVYLLFRVPCYQSAPTDDHSHLRCTSRGVHHANGLKGWKKKGLIMVTMTNVCTFMRGSPKNMEVGIMTKRAGSVQGAFRSL